MNFWEDMRREVGFLKRQNTMDLEQGRGLSGQIGITRFTTRLANFGEQHKEDSKSKHFEILGGFRILS